MRNYNMEDMNWKKYIKKALCLAFEPIRRNANFFTFMYILGVLTAVVTLPRWRELYDNLYLELFSTSTSFVLSWLLFLRKYASASEVCSISSCMPWR